MNGWPGRAAPAGRAGLIAIGASVAGTFAVAVAGPSVMEPALPGRPGQPPWSFGLHLSPYAAVGLNTLGSELLTCRFDFGGRWKISGLFSCVTPARTFKISHAPNATSHVSGRRTKCYSRDRL